MADIQQLIQKIVSDPKIAASSNFASKVYRDEPILLTAPQLERFIPPQIREMRKIARRGWPVARTFYEQGKLMESFTDDFDYRGEFSQYFPTYQGMSDVQLRGYFSWRTRVRAGKVEKTCLSFAFVYIYELLNRIGVASPEEGFHALKNFWTAYRELDPRITAYVTLWLRDYVVYNNLDKSLLQGLAEESVDKAVIVLLDHRAYGDDEVFAALNSLSAYALTESKFYLQHPDEVKTVVCRVFAVVSDYYSRNPEKNAWEKLFGRICTRPYAMFRSAVFYHRHGGERRVYEIGIGHRYIFVHSGWLCERFFSYGQGNKRIGALLKAVDYLMRQRYGYKSALQPGKTNKALTGKIEKVIEQYERSRRESAARKIDIDVSKLHGIRAAALATQSKLLVEEPEEGRLPDASDRRTKQGHAMGLSGDEYRFLQCLLSGTPYGERVRSSGVPFSVLMDGINAKLFDAFGDTVIVDAGGCPELVGDYLEELKGMLAE